MMMKKLPDHTRRIYLYQLLRIFVCEEEINKMERIDKCYIFFIRKNFRDNKSFFSVTWLGHNYLFSEIFFLIK